MDKKIGAAPNPEQREEEKRRAQQLEAEREEARKREIRDQVLMETYKDKSQVRAAYDAKLSSLDTSITLANSVVEKLINRRETLMKSAAAGERGGGAVTQKLQQELRDINQQIGHQGAYIEARRSERKNLEETAAQDIERFEQLNARRLGAGYDGAP